MRVRRLLTVMLCLALPGLAQALAIPALPAGMCALDEKVSEQATVVNYLRAANAGSNDVLATFARCDELAAIAAKKGTSITHYGAILRQSLGEALPLERSAYIETAALAYSANAAALTETALTGAREAVATGTKDSDITNPKAITAANKGVLFKNKDMLILGIRQTNTMGSQTTNVASTTALTLVGGTPISVNLYAPDAPAAFTQSSNTLQPFVTQLIAANP
jgi:hypothetical protein